MNIKEFEYLAEIASQESISKAAARLYLSQPTLSKFLKKIEDEFETPLFYRVGKKMLPTPAGQKCIECARRVLEDSNRLNKEIEYIRQTAHGYIRIGTSASRGEFFITKILPEMIRRYPQSRFILSLESKSNLMKKMEAGELDLIFVTNSAERAYLQYHNIAKEEMVLVVPDGHELLGKQLVKTQEWISYPFIIADVSMTTGQYVRLLFDYYHQKPNTVLEVGSLQFIYSAVRKNIGITIAPSMPLIQTDHINLHYLPFEDERNIEWYFTAVLKEETVLTKPLQELIQLVKDEYRKCSNSNQFSF